MSNTNPVVARVWTIGCGCGCHETPRADYAFRFARWWDGSSWTYGSNLAREYATLPAARVAKANAAKVPSRRHDKVSRPVILRRGRRKSLPAQMAECAERAMGSMAK